MLGDELKQTIQRAYSQVLENKQHKPRWGQRLMIAEIAKLLSSVQFADEGDSAAEAPFCVIEAGTGTGKTLAYTLAVMPIAQALGKKVVISTATVALQEQIVYRDLPDIQQHSGLHFSFSLAKGRSRYVCLSKLDNVLIDANQNKTTLPLYPDEIRPQVDAQSIDIYHSMLEALAANRWEGDRDSWSQQVDDAQWYGVTSDRNQCTGRRCANVTQCSFFKARENLHNADCIVTNHDLVLADLALGGGAILPDPAETIYIFDEGHHLPGRALSHFTHTCRLRGSAKWLEQLQKMSSGMGKQLAVLKGLQKPLEQVPSLAEELRQYTSLAQPVVEAILEQAKKSSADERLQGHRFPHGVVPEPLKELAVELAARYGRLVDLLSRLHKDLSEELEDEFCEVPKPELEGWYAALGQLLMRAEAMYGLWLKYTIESKSGLPEARWIAVIDSGGFIDYELCCSPILAAEQLRKSLWNRCYAAVITSATLTALGSFSRYAMQSGLPEQSVYKQVPSPFDYQNAASLHVPLMPCEPNQPDLHTETIIEMLPSLVSVDEGTLMLFSSRRQMRDVYAGLDEGLKVKVLMQGDRSKMELLRRHCELIDQGKGSIIFGLASFAEGVDLPGKYCTHVIIAKIPFAVPDDPVEAALAEWISAGGGNPFMEIAVPDAALRLVQASGRLLRSETDYGKITLLDRRIVSKRYGKAILDSLPPFRREIA